MGRSKDSCLNATLTLILPKNGTGCHTSLSSACRNKDDLQRQAAQVAFLMIEAWPFSGRRAGRLEIIRPFGNQRAGVSAMEIGEE